MDSRDDKAVTGGYVRPGCNDGKTTDMPELTDLRVRLATPDDGADCAAIYTPIVEQTTTSFELDPPTAAEMAERIEKALKKYPWLVCETMGNSAIPSRVVGYAYGTTWRARPAYQWTVEVAIYVHEAWRGRGIGRALYGELFERLRSQGFNMAVAGIALPNAESIGLHMALGFRSVGVFHQVGYKLGRWVDVAWFEREIQSPSGTADQLA